MRVVEVFGPTVQGEGPYAGRVCHFLRLGGCDYRCSWCDTPQAVDPAQVRAAPDFDPLEVLGLLAGLDPAPMLVISGGNPALWDLDDLVVGLQAFYDVVAVETQGSVWRNWLRRVDSLVVSPKPPSSGMASAQNWRRMEAFMAEALAVPGVVLKIVVFDADDLDWAGLVHGAFPQVPLYLSAGTEPDEPLAATADRYRWLCESVTAAPDLHSARVLPQLHVVAWGHRVGV